MERWPGGTERDRELNPWKPGSSAWLPVGTLKTSRNEISLQVLSYFSTGADLGPSLRPTSSTTSLCVGELSCSGVQYVGCSSSEFHRKERRPGQPCPDYEQRALLWMWVTKSEEIQPLVRKGWVSIQRKRANPRQFAWNDRDI